MRTALELVAEERQRQIEQEGWTFEHDDKHTEDELSLAAASYLLALDLRKSLRPQFHHAPPDIWSFSEKWWKPTPDDRIRELVKGCAMAVAEIERLQRLATKEGGQDE